MSEENDQRILTSLRDYARRIDKNLRIDTNPSANAYGTFSPSWRCVHISKDLIESPSADAFRDAVAAHEFAHALLWFQRKTLTQRINYDENNYYDRARAVTIHTPMHFVLSAAILADIEDRTLSQSHLASQAFGPLAFYQSPHLDAAETAKFFGLCLEQLANKRLSPADALLHITAYYSAAMLHRDNAPASPSFIADALQQIGFDWK